MDVNLEVIRKRIVILITGPDTIAQIHEIIFRRGAGFRRSVRASVTWCGAIIFGDGHVGPTSPYSPPHCHSVHHQAGTPTPSDQQREHPLCKI